MTHAPDILALDFDGVLCDGLLEYFQTAWKAYCQLFQISSEQPPVGLDQDFYALRPVVETGWEMPVLIHAVQSGYSREAIFQDWPPLAQQLLAEAHLDRQAAAAAIDGMRDRWIKADLEGWLGLHRFYPGVIERVKSAIAEGVYPIIVSTKEGRFIKQLLDQQGVTLNSEQILGKEIKQPKYITLRQLQSEPPAGTAAAPSIWFVEDRLKALDLTAEQSDLVGVTLFLADWGYNTAAEKSRAEQSERIHRLALSQFTAPFTAWLS